MAIPTEPAFLTYTLHLNDLGRNWVQNTRSELIYNNNLHARFEPDTHTALIFFKKQVGTAFECSDVVRVQGSNCV